MLGVHGSRSFGSSRSRSSSRLGGGPEVRSGTIRAAGRCPGAPGTRHRTRRPARWPGRRSSASGDVPTSRRGPVETPDRAPSGSAQLVRRGHAYGGPAPLSRMRTCGWRIGKNLRVVRCARRPEPESSATTAFVRCTIEAVPSVSQGGRAIGVERCRVLSNQIFSRFRRQAAIGV